MPLKLNSSGGGSVTLQEPSTASTLTVTLPSQTQTLGIVSATAQASTSGTAIDFTDIPSWVKRITVMFNGVSTSGTSIVQVQLGSGSPQTSGYVSVGTGITGSTVSSTTNLATGFAVGNDASAAASTRVGTMVFTLLGLNTWVANIQYALSNVNRINWASGSVTLSGVLDNIRITTVNGTDTFDAGTINIMYEG